MSYRLVEVFTHDERREHIDELLEGRSLVGHWYLELDGSELMLRVVIETEACQDLCDDLERTLLGDERSQLVLLPVEAVLPRPEEPEAEGEEEGRAREAAAAEEETEPATPSAARHREELYQELASGLRSPRSYTVLLLLSAIVAAVGLLRDQVAVVIGAMVIAPLIGPSVALSFATTLGDSKLIARASRYTVGGIGLAIAVAILGGMVLTVDPTMPAIASRSQVNLMDVALALASGAAGAMSVTTGMSTALIGVMVAVALLPPLVVLGMLLGAGYWDLAFQTLLLFLTNLICINLAGVVTFLAQGISPRTWWEADRAKRAVRIAVSLWSALLAGLVAIILFAHW